MSQADSAAPQSDLVTRFSAAVALIAVALLAVYFGGWAFRALVLVAAAVMLIEWCDMHRIQRVWAYAGIAALAGLLLGATEWLYPAGQMDDLISTASFTPAWLGVAAACAAAMVLGLAARRVKMATGFLYVAIPSFLLAVLGWIWMDVVLWMMLVTWTTDIGAYFAGRALRGPRLAPRISPNKTWSGLIGGVIGAAIVGWLAAAYFGLGSPFLEAGGVMAVAAQAGDLYESWLKRKAGVKDSGTILPGHGGAMDRLDGFLPVIVLTFAMLAAGLWTA